MCYQIYCSSTHLTIKINNDLVVCPRPGGNVKIDGYDGYINCPDYNLMCGGTVICNDIFDCIEKKSLVKESSYNYDYTPETTQKFSKIRQIAISEAYDLSDDGFCPKYCSQCDINKKCKKCKEGYNCERNKDSDNDGGLNTTLLVFISIISVLVVIGIGVAIFLIFKKKNVEKSAIAVEMVDRMKNKN